LILVGGVPFGAPGLLMVFAPPPDGADVVEGALELASDLL